MLISTIFKTVLRGLAIVSIPIAAMGQTVAPTVHQQLKWREMGPYRAGRTTTVAGVAGHPERFYMGTAGGGVWRTDNAGTTWNNVSDGSFNTGSIGAVAVSSSDPNRIYVGTGESSYRLYMSSPGDGVYRSDDGGKTWRHAGLARTRQIGGIAIDPGNPDTLLVAAQGDPWSASPDRGIYRSTDGGQSWTRTLATNPMTGAARVEFDPSDPHIAYATTWDHDYDPWFLRSGGPGSGIYKSSDGGQSWARLTTGLPVRMGKIGLAVSPVDPRLIWATIESDPGSGGLYRSDDAGETWRFVNADRRVHTRPWYYMHIWADPRSKDGVYVLANPPVRSVDGGKTFSYWDIKGWDFHALWLDPANPQSMIVGSDGGATVTKDGGVSWSPLANQPTAQLYRIHADNAWPYFVYAAQQDNTTLAMSSNRAWGGVDSAAPTSVGGGESGFVATHPVETRFVYASSEIGTLTEYDRQTGALRWISPSLAFPEGAYPRDLSLRYAVNSPVLVSWDDPGTVYHGAQKVMRTTDRGQNWTAVSPDLTRNDRTRQGPGGGPFNGELINHFGAISYLAQSPCDARIIWAGSNDGYVHVTRDGAGWTNVTPESLLDGQIDSIEASPHASGRAFVVVNRMRLGDYEAHVLRTDDFGRSWTTVSAGLPADTIARVVREDPVRKGLLFAGTERGLFLSYDDGTSWQPAGGNSPITPVTDLVVRRDDLVASTAGRGVWALDNITPLRQADPAAARPRLLHPGQAYLLFPEAEDGMGPNPYEYGTTPAPPTGIAIDFELDAETHDARIEIIDGDGRIVCKLEPAKGEVYRQGLNRVMWNLRREATTVVPGAFDGIFRGARVSPGTYSARLVVGDRTFEQPLTVVVDPRLRLSPSELVDRDRLIAGTTALMKRVNTAVAAVRNGAKADPSRQSAAKAWEEKIHAWQLEIGQDRVNYGGRFLFDLQVFLEAVDRSSPPFGPHFYARLAELVTAWDRLEAEAKLLK